MGFEQQWATAQAEPLHAGAHTKPSPFVARFAFRLESDDFAVEEGRSLNIRDHQHQFGEPLTE